MLQNVFQNINSLFINSENKISNLNPLNTRGRAIS